MCGKWSTTIQSNAILHHVVYSNFMVICREDQSAFAESIMVTVWVPHDKVQNGGEQPISEILHIENWIVCCIETISKFVRCVL